MWPLADLSLALEAMALSLVSPSCSGVLLGPAGADAMSIAESSASSDAQSSEGRRLYSGDCFSMPPRLAGAGNQLPPATEG